jgi:hypothetical protein
MSGPRRGRLISILLALAIVAYPWPAGRAQETAQACEPAAESSSLSPSAGDTYRGPLVDTHLHLSLIRRFGSAPALCSWLDRRQVLWAIGFVPVAVGREPGSLDAMLPGAQSRVIFLLRPTNAGSFAEFSQGRYTTEMLRPWLFPQGVFRGFGEVSLHPPEMASVGFASAPMQTLYRAVNQMRGVIMVHPRGDRIRGTAPRAHSPAELEPVLQQHPDITFLFHGGPDVFDPFVAPLMARYPNVFFTFDATLWLFTFPLGRNALGQMDPSASAERFFSDVSAAGGIDQIVERALPLALPRMRRFPDRVMWGTDLLLEWHFEDRVATTVFLTSRKLIHRLPADLQEPYAFGNAARVFGQQLLRPR